MFCSCNSDFLFHKNNEQGAKCYGLYVGENVDSSLLDSYSSKYLKRPCVIMFFWSWSNYPFINYPPLDVLKSNGVIPVITLEPWTHPEKKAISLRDIANGKEDKILIAFAKALKEYNSPVFIRFAHEMNGNWYPWSGNGDEYKKAWIHIHDLVEKWGDSKKIFWIFSINVEDIPHEKWNEITNYYPGEQYVDVIGVDGYNWGESKEWSKWSSYVDIFQKRIDSLAHEYKHPLYITEIATVNDSKLKPLWILSFLEMQKKNPIDIFIWFDLNKESDWRIESDLQSLQNFRKGISGLKDSFPNPLMDKLLERK